MRATSSEADNGFDQVVVGASLQGHGLPRDDAVSMMTGVRLLWRSAANRPGNQCQEAWCRATMRGREAAFRGHV